MLSETKLIRIWPGERRLLPSPPENHDLLLRCLTGKAYLRIMSQARRRVIGKGEALVIANNEIATLSGVAAMLVNIRYIKQKEYSVDC